MEQETVSGSGISWAICKSAPRSRQITTPAPHHSEPRDFIFGTLTYHSTSHPAEEKSLKGAWSGSPEQFLHCGLRKFRHSKSSVYRWYTQLDRRRFVYDTWDNGSRLGRVMVECTLSIMHCLRLNLQLHTIDLFRACRISSFCTLAFGKISIDDTLRGPSAIAELLVPFWYGATQVVLDRVQLNVCVCVVPSVFN